jgi:hypothetical protein
MSIRSASFLVSLAMAGVFTGCSGGSSTMPNPTPSPQRGQLLQTPPALLATYQPTQLVQLLSGSDFSQVILYLTLSPKCAVNVYQIKYETVGGQNEATTASGALMMPSGTDPACQGPRPILMYAHGTSSDKAFNIANLPEAGEGQLVATLFAAQGYVVVAPNYAGYDTSTLSYHPYLNATQQSDDMIDALSAARSALPVAASTSVTDSGKLFLTGYSQGGFVAMATLRAMQASNMTVTAAAPMSGPYALAAFGDAVFLGEVNASGPPNLVAVVTSYQHAYGDLYTNASDIFEQQYAGDVIGLLPSTTSISVLYQQGKLPQNALFSSTPPAPQYAPNTPATTPADLAPIFALGFGANDLVTNAYRLSFLQDQAANPDGGFPTFTNNAPAPNPGNALRKALKVNDLRTFTPTVPTLMCGGNMDPTVFYLDTQLMQSYWASSAPTSPYTVLDVDSAGGASDPYSALKQQFNAAKLAIAADAVASGATDLGQLAVLQKYHATLVAPFCLYAVTQFFAAH